MNIFKTMSEVLKNTPYNEDEVKQIPSYIFCRYLSGSMNFIQIANILNRFYDIPIENQYLIVKNFSHYNLKNQIRYIPYPKSANQSMKEYENISKFYRCSLERAKEYRSLMSKEELKKIEDMYAE